MLENPTRGMIISCGRIISAPTCYSSSYRINMNYFELISVYLTICSFMRSPRIFIRALRTHLHMQISRSGRDAISFPNIHAKANRTPAAVRTMGRLPSSMSFLRALPSHRPGSCRCLPVPVRSAVSQFCSS